MNHFLKKIAKNLALFISVMLNVVVFLSFILFSKMKATTLEYFLVGVFTKNCIHSAFVVSVPEDSADVAFGPAEFSLKRGSQAALQFSFIYSNRRQANLSLEPLYDPAVISCSPSGYGLIVTGREKGETILQIFQGGSFRDIARILVYDGYE